MKPILEVFNVGQGDAFILHPVESCSFKEYDLIVDIGTNNRDLTKYFGEKVKLMITHAHSDHLFGFQYFTGEDFNKVDELILPLYFNEVLVISKMITKIIGVKSLDYSKAKCKSIDDIIRNCYILGKSAKRIPITYVHDNMNLCSHIEIMNPPNPEHVSEDLYREMKATGFELFKGIYDEVSLAEIISLLNSIYDESLLQDHVREASPEVLGMFNLYRTISSEHIKIQLSGVQRMNFILEYFKNSALTLKAFCKAPSKAHFKILYSAYTEICNNSSIVFKYSHTDSQTGTQTRFLFAGDAGKSIFERMIKKGHALECDYFKTAHHGNVDSLNKTILKKIGPKHAIISHGNGHAGRSNATHPIQKTIALLKAAECDVYCTNDVVKNNEVLHKKYLGYTEDRCVEFK